MKRLVPQSGNLRSISLLLASDDGFAGASNGKLGNDAHPTRAKQQHQIIQDLVGNSLMADYLLAVVIERLFQAFSCNHGLGWDGIKHHGRKIREAEFRQQKREFGDLSMDRLR